MDIGSGNESELLAIDVAPRLRSKNTPNIHGDLDVGGLVRVGCLISILTARCRWITVIGCRYDDTVKGICP